MTEEKDEALEISNPRLLCAIYFTLLAVIANQAIDTFLYAVGVQELLPIYKAILLAVVIGEFINKWAALQRNHFDDFDGRHVEFSTQRANKAADDDHFDQHY